MGEEHKGKGVDMQLGPVAGPLGRSPEGARNWEGFSPDPVLTGVLFAESIKGIQSVGVMTSAKHYIAYEQDHFRLVPDSTTYGWNISEPISSNLDDETLHELYLWPFAGKFLFRHDGDECRFLTISQMVFVLVPRRLCARTTRSTTRRLARTATP
jgi:beta-glucosidase-like glycosyl hydrolase